MPKRRNRIDFNDVRTIALELPGVEECTTSRGLSLKVRGRLLTCPAIHKSAEPNSLMVRISLAERAHLLADDPDTYYLTDHYSSYPAVLVRLSQISRDSLRDLLESAARFVSAKTTKGSLKARRS
ncbi:MAG TPA: hypothetical protein VI485_00565 [Vicinamibacterales bacterium]|nr:hypothetical protein [Vicinamibacterales bacterium]